MCVPVPNFVAIRRTVAEIWRFFDFSKMAAVRHLGFLNFLNYNGRNAQEDETASSCQVLLKSVEVLRRYGDFSIFPRWRLSAILNL